MKNNKLKIFAFVSLGAILLSEIFRAAILATGNDYNTAAFAPVRVIGLIGVNALIFCLFSFLVSRKIDDREFPSRLRDKKLMNIFLFLGTIAVGADCIKDSFLYPETVSASAATIFSFFLWLATGSLLSLGEVSGSPRTNRILRSVLCIAVSLISILAYVLGWAVIFYK